MTATAEAAPLVVVNNIGGGSGARPQRSSTKNRFSSVQLYDSWRAKMVMRGNTPPYCRSRLLANVATKIMAQLMGPVRQIRRLGHIHPLQSKPKITAQLMGPVPQIRRLGHIHNCRVDRNNVRAPFSLKSVPTCEPGSGLRQLGMTCKRRVKCCACLPRESVLADSYPSAAVVPAIKRAYGSHRNTSKLSVARMDSFPRACFPFEGNITIGAALASHAELTSA